MLVLILLKTVSFRETSWISFEVFKLLFFHILHVKWLYFEHVYFLWRLIEIFQSNRMIFAFLYIFIFHVVILRNQSGTCSHLYSNSNEGCFLKNLMNEWKTLNKPRKQMIQVMLHLWWVSSCFSRMCSSFYSPFIFFFFFETKLRPLLLQNSWMIMNLKRISMKIRWWF